MHVCIYVCRIHTCYEMISSVKIYYWCMLFKDNLKWFLFLVTCTTKIIVHISLRTFSNGHLNFVCQLIPDSSILHDMHVRKAW